MIPKLAFGHDRLIRIVLPNVVSSKIVNRLSDENPVFTDSLTLEGFGANEAGLV